LRGVAVDLFVEGVEDFEGAREPLEGLEILGLGVDAEQDSADVAIAEAGEIEFVVGVTLVELVAFIEEVAWGVDVGIEDEDVFEERVEAGILRGEERGNEKEESQTHGVCVLSYHVLPLPMGGEGGERVEFVAREAEAVKSDLEAGGRGQIFGGAAAVFGEKEDGREDGVALFGLVMELDGLGEEIGEGPAFGDFAAGDGVIEAGEDGFGEHGFAAVLEEGGVLLGETGREFPEGETADVVEEAAEEGFIGAMLSAVAGEGFGEARHFHGVVPEGAHKGALEHGAEGGGGEDLAAVTHTHEHGGLADSLDAEAGRVERGVGGAQHFAGEYRIGADDVFDQGGAGHGVLRDLNGLEGCGGEDGEFGDDGADVFQLNGRDDGEGFDLVGIEEAVGGEGAQFGNDGGPSGELIGSELPALDEEAAKFEGIGAIHRGRRGGILCGRIAPHLIDEAGQEPRIGREGEMVMIHGRLPHGALLFDVPTQSLGQFHGRGGNSAAVSFKRGLF